MKFKRHLNEVSGNVAYWISRSGELVEVGTSHIDVVISNPTKFGYTGKKIRDIYDKYGEVLGVEGQAREEIIVDLIKHGWIRVRKYRNQGYSVNINKFSKKIKDVLFDWASKLISSGIKGVKETDKYIPVNIQAFGSGENKSLTIQDIANDVLFESGETFDEENSIIILESASEFRE